MIFSNQISCFQWLLTLLTLLHALIAATAVQNPCSQVRNAQFICVDCQTYGFCSQVNGAWVTAELGKCDGFLFCNEDAHGCSYSRECNIPQRGPQFECQNPGFYPNPYDCKYYHECSTQNEHTMHVCANGLGYDVAKATCSLSKQSDACKKRQFECKKSGEFAAWKSESSIYYVCISQNIDGQSALYPLLYRCPVGQVFVDGECVLNASKLPDGTTFDPTSCRKGSLIGVPTDCHAYKRCGDSISMSCPKGTRFNAPTESCVPGNC